MSFEIKDDVEGTRKFIAKTFRDSSICIQYIVNNYTDIDLVQPITAQLLALYYKGGTHFSPFWSIEKLPGAQRFYSIQYIPCMIGCYLQAVSKKQYKSVAMFETFFLAVYNEEVMAGVPGNEMTTKKVGSCWLKTVESRKSMKMMA